MPVIVPRGVHDLRMNTGLKDFSKDQDPTDSFK